MGRERTPSNRSKGAPRGSTSSKRSSRSKDDYSDEDDSSSEENSNFLSRMFGSNDADEDDDDSYTDGGDTISEGDAHSRKSNQRPASPPRSRQPRRTSVGSGCSSYDDTVDDEGSRSEYDSDGDSDSYDNATFMSNPALDLVARLVSNDTSLTEISIDEASITSNPRNSNNPAVNVRAAWKVAQHIADALQKTTYLKKLTLVGSWSTSASVPLESASTGKECKENDDASCISSSTRGPQLLGGLVLDTILAGLEKNTSIKTLVLQNNHRMDRHTAHVFGTAIARHSRIKRLTFTQSHFVGSGLTLLLLGIQHSKTIKSLQIQHCNLGDPTPDALDSVAASLSLMKLTSLQLQDTNIHDPPSLAFLLENVQRTTSLEELDLSHNYLGPEGVALLAQCLAGENVVVDSGGNKDKDRRKNGKQQRQQITPQKNIKNHIKTLTLVDCGITRSASVKLLANALRDDTTLTNINISHNAFGDNGARRWRSLLEHNHSITTLQLMGCGVGAAKLHDLANKLRYNNSFLKNLGFTSDVSLAILDGVTVMGSFSNEYLGGGGVGSAGGGGSSGIRSSLSGGGSSHRA